MPNPMPWMDIYKMAIATTLQMMWLCVMQIHQKKQSKFFAGYMTENVLGKMSKKLALTALGYVFVLIIDCG
jgi:hypothetical protein